MNEHSDLLDLFTAGIEELRGVIENGHGNIPVLDPLKELPTLHGEFKFGKEHHPHGDLTLSLVDPVVTGLKTVALTGEPAITFATKSLHFSLTLDELILNCPDFKIEGDLKALIKEHHVELDKELRVELKKIHIDFTFSIAITDGQPVISAGETVCDYGSLKVHFGHEVLANLILPWFQERIETLMSDKLATALSGILTQKVQGIYQAQKATFDKMVGLYKMKLDQGGWPEGHSPRLEQGFDGVGELPLPMFWELPSVAVDKLEHRPVEQIMEECRTGDVILFSGTAPSSQRIRRYTQSPFSHAIVVIKEPEFMDSHALIWQATSSSHRGVLRDMTVKSGIQLNILDEMIHDYRSEAPGANVVHRKLIRDERPAGEEEAGRQKVIEFIRAMDSKPYTSDMDGLYVMGLLEVDDPNQEDFFCAGLVAETLMRFGILKRTFRQYQYAPRDFCDLQQCLPFVAEGTSFSEEVVIDIKP